MTQDDQALKVASQDNVAIESTSVLTLEVEQTLQQAQIILANPNRRPEELETLKNKLSGLLSQLTSGLTPMDLMGLDPSIIDQLTSILPVLTADNVSNIRLEPAQEQARPKVSEETTIQQDREMTSSGDDRIQWIESGKKLSECALWKLQEDYYATQGIDAWNAIPFFVTNSTYISESYSDVIIRFLQDRYQQINKKEPVYIIEMASGSGRFSVYMLMELSRKLQAFSKLKEIKLRYIMTDFTEKNIQFWENHPKFKPYIESGLLDFGIFRPEDDQQIELRQSKKLINRQTVQNPMFAIANYFFDTVPHDDFRVAEGKLQEGRINISRHLNEEVNEETPLHIQQVVYDYDYETISPNYYEDKKLNEVLAYYEQEFHKASIVFPIGAFRCIKNLLTMSKNNLCLISSDKGFTDMEYMMMVYQNEYAIHDGAFSFMVNYHAIAKYFELQGGTNYFTRYRNLDLNTQVSILTPDKATRFEEVAYAFERTIGEVNPINHLYHIQNILSEDTAQNVYHRLNGFIALMRMSLYDPGVFCRFSGNYIEAMDNLTSMQKTDLLHIMDRVWDKYYQFGGEGNVTFAIGQMLFALNMWEQSIFFINKSIEIHGEHEILLFLAGKAYQNIGQIEEAHQYMKRAKALSNELDAVNESLKELEIILRERKLTSNLFYH